MSTQAVAPAEASTTTFHYTKRIICRVYRETSATYVRYASTEQLSEWRERRFFRATMNNEMIANRIANLGAVGSKLIKPVLSLAPAVISIELEGNEVSIELSPAAIPEEFKPTFDEIIFELTGILPDYDLKLERSAKELLCRVKTRDWPKFEEQRGSFWYKYGGAAIKLTPNHIEPTDVLNKAFDLAVTGAVEAPGSD